MVITLADNSTTTVSIQNGKGISSIAKTGTSGLVDTYTITYNDATTQTFTVTNGAKGDTGDAWYVWIRYAGSQPTQDSDMGTTPDNWMGIYSGTSSTAPTHYTDYEWFQIKGEKGDTGAAADIVNQSVSYLASTSGTIVPEGSWSPTIPTVPQGSYLWTKSECVYNDGTDVIAYSVARMGIDGTGSVVSVNTISPDGSGNVTLTASDIAASDNTSVQAHLTAAETNINLLKNAIIYPTGDQTDRAAEIATKLSTYGYCEFVKGEYYIGSTITLPNKSTIKGCGNESIIKRTSGSTANTMFYITGSSGNITVKDLYFVGTNTSKPTTENTGSGEIAVALDDHANRVTIENCNFFGLTKSGISYTSGYEWLTSINVTNCTFLFCNYGISAGRYGEFAHVTNCSFNSCYYGALVVGGNNNFVNCGFDGNNTGFVLYDDSSTPTNDGHGACVGCTFNHNTVQAISINNIDNGYIFSGCCVFYGNIFILNSKGIIIDSCLLLGHQNDSNFSNITVQNCPGQISITNILSLNVFRINRVGTNPHIIARNCRTTNGAVIFDNEPVKVVDAVTTIASINANGGASATVDVAIPSGYKALTAVAGYTSSGCIIASCYTTTGAASGYQRIGMFVFNESLTPKTNESVTCHVLFTPNEY